MVTVLILQIVRFIYNTLIVVEAQLIVASMVLAELQDKQLILQHNRPKLRLKTKPKPVLIGD